jgi:DNA-binding IclR family transcriptional regulator
VGKALLAELGVESAGALVGTGPLKAVTPHSVTDPAKLMAQLRAARRQGMAETEDEGTEGVAAMAVAGHIGDQLVAFSIFGPTERLKRQRTAYRKALLRAKELAFGVEGAPEAPVAATS